MYEHRKMAEEIVNPYRPWEIIVKDVEAALRTTASKSEKDGYRKGVEKAEKFLLDHYWDSIEDKKDLLNLHIKACFKHLIREEGK